MRSRILILGFVFGLILFQAIPVFALLPYMDAETAVPVERGRSRLDTSLILERTDKTKETRSSLRGELSYGLINNLDFSVDVPYHFLNKKGGPDEDGLGDLKLKAKIRFIKGREANPVSIAGQLSVKFPSCNKDKMLAAECTGEADVGVRAIASKEFFPVTVHLNLGYLFVGNPAGDSLDDVFKYSLAFDYLANVDYVHVVGELAGETNRDPGASDDPLAVLTGILYDVDVDKVLSVTVSLGLTDASPDYGTSVGFRYLF